MSDDPAMGGTVTLTYLVNTLTGEKASFDLEIAWDDDRWRALSGGQEVRRLRCLENRPFLSPIAVGIKTIEVEFAGGRGIERVDQSH